MYADNDDEDFDDEDEDFDDEDYDDEDDEDYDDEDDEDYSKTYKDGKPLSNNVSPKSPIRKTKD